MAAISDLPAGEWVDVPQHNSPALPPGDWVDVPKAPEQSSWLGGVLRTAAGSSLSGQAYKALTGKDIVEPPTGPISTTQRVIGTGLGMALDPTTVLTAGAGGLAAKAGLGAVVPALTASRIGRAAVEGAGGLGAFSAVQSAAQQETEKGQINPWEVAKKAGEGALLGAAGGAVPAAILPAAMGPVTRAVTSLPIEAGVFTGGQAALEGRAPTAQEFAENLGTFGAMKVAHGALGAVGRALTPEAPSEEIVQPPEKALGQISRLDAAASTAATNPTEGQKEAGNYQKGHLRLNGLDISIENPKGSIRSGVGPEGPWQTEMQSHYGYIRGTVGKDKDHIDAFLGPQAEYPNVPVFVVDQKAEDGKFDEHKVLLGFPDREAAQAGYLANYSPDWLEKQGGKVDLTQTTLAGLKDWLGSGRTKKPFAEEAPASADLPGFYSSLSDLLAKKLPNRGTGEEFSRLLDSWSGQYKKEELEDSGLKEWLEGRGKVTKQEVADYLRENTAEVGEVWKDKGLTAQEQLRLKALERRWQTPGEELTDEEAEEYFKLDRRSRDTAATKFSHWQLPGGENYREMLLALPDRSEAAQLRAEAERRGYGDRIADWPDKEFAVRYRKVVTNAPDTGTFKSSHFDEPNILAHVRANDRVDAEGKKVLFLEEIQSDWHQKGRKYGYGPAQVTREEAIARAKADSERIGESWDLVPDRDKESYIAHWQQVLQQERNRSVVPNAPFKSSWPMLAFKRMLREAAEKGYDKIAWHSTPETLRQSENWEKLEKQGDKWIANGDQNVTPIAERYFTKLPQEVNKYVKRWGGKVGETEILGKYWKGKEPQNVPEGEFENITVPSSAVKEPEKYTVYSLEITPQMREEILGRGQPAYREGAAAGPIGLEDIGASILGGATTPEILQAISQNKGTPFQSVLAKILLKKGIAPSVEVRDEHRALGTYYTQDDRIVLDGRQSRAQAAQTFLHEAVHSATLQWMGENPDHPAVQALTDVMAKVRLSAMTNTDTTTVAAAINKFGGMKLYGLTNPYEFISEVFSNKDFQDYLKTVKVGEGKAGFLQTAWDHVVDFLRKVLGLAPGDRTALAEALEAGVRVLEAAPEGRRASSKFKLTAASESIKHTLSDDIPDQIRWLNQKAQENGYEGTEDLFMKGLGGDGKAKMLWDDLGAQWRVAHPLADLPKPKEDFDALSPLPPDVTRSFPVKWLQRAWEKGKESPLGRDLLLKTAPMAAGEERGQAAAAQFANSQFLARWTTRGWMGQFRSRWNGEERERIQSAMSEQNEMYYGGEISDPNEIVKGRGLGLLSAKELEQARANNAFTMKVMQDAIDIGVVPTTYFDENGEAQAKTPMWWWTARVGVGAGGEKLGPGRVAGAESSLRTQAASLRKRKYVSFDDAEEALRQKYGEDAHFAKDYSASILANGMVMEAIAGRRLVKDVRAINDAMRQADPGLSDIISEEPLPGLVKIDHPAFVENKIKVTPKLDENGEQIIDENGKKQWDKTWEKKPLYVDQRLEGPLRAVLTKPPGQAYRQFMQLKSGIMRMVMPSPQIHKWVELGRAFPVLGTKVLFGSYDRVAKGLENKMVEDENGQQIKWTDRLISRGFRPVAGHGYVQQEMTDVLAEPAAQATVGQGPISRAMGKLVGLIDEESAQRVMGAIDKADEVWFQKLLWDKVYHLQLVIAHTVEDHTREKLIAQGVNPALADIGAQTAAAHMANRYGGTLQTESMSQGFRQLMNIVLFSRSFTFGNLGVMKDIVNGLPEHTRALMMRNVRDLLGTEVGKGVLKDAAEKGETPFDTMQRLGIGLNRATRQYAARKALAAVVIDIGAMAVANAAFQSMASTAAQWWKDEPLTFEYGKRFNETIEQMGRNPLGALMSPIATVRGFLPQAENEPGRWEKVKIGHEATGTATYARSPVGKIGEEFGGAITAPIDMIRRKLNTTVKPLIETLTNSDEWKRPIYLADDSPPVIVTKIVENFVKNQLPMAQLEGAKKVLTGTATATDVAKAALPFAGVTISRGYPGGEAVGSVMAVRRNQEARLAEAIPDIKEKVRAKDWKGAAQAAQAVGMTAQGFQKLVAGTLAPGGRLSAREVATVMQRGTSEEREELTRALQ